MGLNFRAYPSDEQLATIKETIKTCIPDTEKIERRIRHLKAKRSAKTGAQRGERKSKGYRKLTLKLNRLEARQARIRKDAAHNMTRRLVDSHDTIMVRDMGVKGMLEDFDSAYLDGPPKKAVHAMHRQLAARNMYEVRRQIEYM